MKSKNGLSLIELIAVLVVLGIIAGITTVLVMRTVNNAKLSADVETARNINVSMTYYVLDHQELTEFTQAIDDESRLQLLVDSGFLSKLPVAQSRSASFVWDTDLNVWRLQLGEESIPLTIYGDTPEEIAPEIISDIQERYAETGSYGRTWGDYRYTDIGLDPDDWDEPVLHVYYTPSGSNLFLEPEAGYEFLLYNDTGDLFTLTASSNYNLIYNDLDGLWYYHIISEENQVLFETLEIQLSD